MKLVITILQMRLSCTSGLKILMKPNIDCHLSCLTYKSGWLEESLNQMMAKHVIVIRGTLRNVSVPNFGVMSFGDTLLVPCESAKNLGVVLDSSLSFRSHIGSIVKTCNFHIRNLYAIKDFVNRKNLVTLVRSLIVSKVDYCNSLIYLVP